VEGGSSVGKAGNDNESPPKGNEDVVSTTTAAMATMAS
jgi:hypothetical protein